jgi:hypothetical protein
MIWGYPPFKEIVWEASGFGAPNFKKFEAFPADLQWKTPIWEANSQLTSGSEAKPLTQKHR